MVTLAPAATAPALDGDAMAVTRLQGAPQRRKTSKGFDFGMGNVLLVGLTGSCPKHTPRRTLVAKGSGLTRGDRRRNERIAAVRAVVRADRAILAIDLGEDKQVAALMDHEGRVLGRRSLKVKAYGLGGLLTWAAGQAARRGFAGVVVGCEPTGHRWRALMQLADQARMGFVCVQSLRVHLAREADDYTRDKTDHKDAALIGKLIGRLDCYLPERAGSAWARLRHLGARRCELVTETVACRQQIVDLLSCAWPAVLGCAANPLECITWLACQAVVAEDAEDVEDAED